MSVPRGGALSEAVPSEPIAPTQLAEKFANKKFVIAVEVDPPRGHNANRIIEAARELKRAGFDVVHIADTPMARMRMSAWALAHLIQRDTQMETVLHFPTRGRNLLRVQGDLLAAHALGVRNLLVLMGDPPSVGDYPEAGDQHDIVPSGLVKLIKGSLNSGKDSAGISIGTATSFHVGVAVNFYPPDLEREIKTFRKKIMAGADFAVSQPIFDVTPVARSCSAIAINSARCQFPLWAACCRRRRCATRSFCTTNCPASSCRSGRWSVCASRAMAARKGSRSRARRWSNCASWCRACM